MGIRAKTIGLLAALIGLLLVVLLGGIYVVGTQLAANIERREASDAVARAMAVVDDNEAQVVSVAGDWAIWTDTYRFVHGQEPTFPEQNLDPAYVKSIGVDFMVFCDATGKIVYSTQANSRGARVPLSASILSCISGNSVLMHQSNPDSVTVGLLPTEQGVAILCGRPITNNDKTAPAFGTYFTGRFLDAQRIADAEKLTAAPMALYEAKSVALPADVTSATRHLTSSSEFVAQFAPDRLAGYRLVGDILGHETIVMRVLIPRVASEFAQASLVQTSIVMAIMGLLMIGAVVVVSDTLVLKRLDRLGREVAAVGESRDPNSRVRIDGSDEIAGVATGINTMLGQLEESQSDLAYLASHDSLTRLHNRRWFETELRVELARKGSGALLWLDVDHFKEINDSLGHATGDELLSSLANLIVKHTRGTGRVARLGGDEFGILLSGADENQALGAAKHVLDLTAGHAFEAGGHEIRISVSIGIVLFPEHGSSINDLLSRADLAMYQAKSAGRNAMSMFTSDDDWQSEMSERIAMAEQIVRALRDDRFVLFAQPLQRTSDSMTDTFELLLRMYDDDGALVMPDRIIPTAERIGLIRDIDRWVVSRGIALIRAEQLIGRDTCFAVNVSGTAFSDPNLLEAIRKDIASSKIDPSRLIIEITETTAIADIEGAKRFITELREIGCQFSLDDFGAGTSSFYYLKHLPIDYLKIDGSLVKSLGQNTTDEHFVRAIIEMCRGLKIPTVAEYVETAGLYDIVSALGVDFAQGYEVGRPEPLGHYLEEAVRSGLHGPRTVRRQQTGELMAAEATEDLA